MTDTPENWTIILAEALAESDLARLERLRAAFGEGVLRQALLEASHLAQTSRPLNADGSPRSVRQLFYTLVSQHARALGIPLWRVTRPGAVPVPHPSYALFLLDM